MNQQMNRLVLITPIICVKKQAFSQYVSFLFARVVDL